MMKHLNRNILIIFVLIFLASCNWPFVVADGGFYVEGHILDQSNVKLTECTIELQLPDGKIMHGPFHIDSNFKTSFTVAPYKDKYLLYIRCPDYEPYKVIIEYGKTVSPSQPLKLGDIKLKLI